MRGVEVRVGGGTSIMPRVAPTLYDFVGLDDGEYLEVAEAVFRIFDRQDWLRVNRARARIKVLVDKIGIDEMRKLVDEERQGDWVDEREFDVEGLRLDVDEAERAPGVPSVLRLAQRRRLASSSASARRTSPPSARRASRPSRSTCRAATSARAAARAGRHRARATPAAGCARPCTRTSLLRWVRDETVYEVWRGAARPRASATPGADQIGDVVSCPGTDSCKLGITSSMGLNAAVRERLDDDGDHRPAHAQAAHQDERLPERLQPAPHRQHRVLRRVDQGRRAHDPGLRRAHRRQLRGRRDRLRPAPEGPPAGQARARGGRALDPPLRGATARTARSSTPSPPASAPRPSRTRSAISRCRSSSASTRWTTSSTGTARSPFVVQRGEGECAV